MSIGGTVVDHNRRCRERLAVEIEKEDFYRKIHIPVTEVQSRYYNTKGDVPRVLDFNFVFVDDEDVYATKMNPDGSGVGLWKENGEWCMEKFDEVPNRDGLELVWER